MVARPHQPRTVSRDAASRGTVRVPPVRYPRPKVPVLALLAVITALAAIIVAVTYATTHPRRPRYRSGGRHARDVNTRRGLRHERGNHR